MKKSEINKEKRRFKLIRKSMNLQKQDRKIRKLIGFRKK
jgi:hypothetical protein